MNVCDMLGRPSFCVEPREVLKQISTFFYQSRKISSNHLAQSDIGNHLWVFACIVIVSNEVISKIITVQSTVAIKDFSDAKNNFWGAS